MNKKTMGYSDTFYYIASIILLLVGALFVFNIPLNNNPDCVNFVAQGNRLNICLPKPRTGDK